MAQKTALYPGYRHVEAFGPDDDYEPEEEVSYVTIDLGTIEPTLVPSSSSYRLIGLDTPTPFLQLSGTIFKGQHQSLLGTELLFSDAKDDQSDQGTKCLVDVGTTESRIRFKEVELRERKEDRSSEAPTIAQVNKGKNKKDRIPETVDEVTGTSFSERATPPVRRGRGKRTGKGKTKGKGKEREGDQIEEDDTTMDDMVVNVTENSKETDVTEEGEGVDVASAATSRVLQENEDDGRQDEWIKASITSVAGGAAVGSGYIPMDIDEAVG